MLYQTLFAMVFASATVVQATRSNWQSRDLQSAGQCETNCLKNIKAVSDCAQKDDVSCVCSFGSDTFMQILKCTFDCVTLDDLKGVSSLPTTPASPSSQCGSTPAPPKGTLASNFNLPACANNCLTKTSFTGCTGSSDVACICNIMDGNSTSADSLAPSYNYEKCMLDSCSQRDAAKATIQMGADCGQFSTSTPASQFPFPLNKLKETYDSPNSSSGLRGPTGALILLINAGVALGLLMM